MPIIDSQVHAYEANTPKRPWHSVPNWPPHVTGDEMVAAMDKVGVDGAIFISAFSLYQYDASYAVEVQRAHPTRMAIVKPVDPARGNRRLLFEFSNRILKCLDAANRPYAETLRLGLCPKEWLVGDDAAGVNTLKAANGFLKALKAKMGDKLGRRPNEAEISAAWVASTVSNDSR